MTDSPTKRVVVICHDIRKGVRDVTTRDDPLRFARLIGQLQPRSEILLRRVNSKPKFGTHQQEGEDDASDKQPLADLERDGKAPVDVRAIVEHLLMPTCGGQHGDRGENIRDVDEKGFEDKHIEPEISVVVVDVFMSKASRDWGHWSLTSSA